MAKRTKYKNLDMQLDTSGLDKIKADLVNLKLNHVRYGIVDDVTYPTGDVNGRAGVYVAEIWKRLEYGHVNVTSKGVNIIPPRPIFKIHMNTDAKEAFKKIATSIISSVFSGTYVRDTAHQKIGMVMQEKLKYTLKTYKGFKALVLPKGSPRSPYDFYDDTGFLISKISFRVMPTALPLGVSGGGTT